MRWKLISLAISWVILLVLQSPSTAAVTKPHVITFGKWTSVQWLPESGTDKMEAIKIRALLVDARVKEYVTGSPHEVTDRLFVVRRAFRINDSLPDDTALRWQWQLGGWLLVDRLTGRVSAINLADFDSSYSTASWYRDYVAYCGVADDGKKTYAVVAQLGRRKALLKKEISDHSSEVSCAEPEWQRGPVRVSFESSGTQQTFAIRGHRVDVVNDTEEEE